MLRRPVLAAIWSSVSDGFLYNPLFQRPFQRVPKLFLLRRIHAQDW
jgi:hypothetical protein